MPSKNTAAQMLAAGRKQPDRPAAPEPAAQESTVTPIDQPTSRPVALQYEKAGFFVTPNQRQWVDDTVHDLKLKGISGSDVVRLALDQLRAAVADGTLDLGSELVEQAYREVEQFPGRKNRGMPPRPARLS